MMYGMLDYQRIIKEFNQTLRLRSKSLFKTWMTVFVLWALITLMLRIFLPQAFIDEPGNILIIIYGYIPSGLLLMVALLSLRFHSEKATFQSLFANLYKQLSRDESIIINYETYPKEKQLFNQQGGLYPLYSTSRVKRKVSGQTKNGHSFTIYDTVIVTSSGKSSTTHFNGIYMVIKSNHDTYLQIRSSGKPRLKNITFEERENIKGFKIFTKQQDIGTVSYHVFVDELEKLRNQNSLRAIDLSIIPGEMHLGMYYKMQPARKQKEINQSIINHLYQHFLYELEIVDTLAEL